MSFIVKEVAISEDLLGCVSESEAHIFQVILNPHLLKATSEEKETKEQEKRSKSRSKTRSASRSPGRSSSDSFSSSSRLRGRWPSQKEEITGSFIRNADDYTDLSQLIWVPTLSYGHKRPTDDRHFLLFPSLVGAAHCGPVAEPGEVIGPEDPNWSDQRAALKELYAPRPSYLNLLPPFNVESSNEKKTEKNSTDDGGSSESREMMYLQLFFIF
ncbi:hypothetical protein SK128_002653 [Halocaridina rubra]|uniref:Uncharacterized protein n=1 Tax=Halocaridina rubra TaxID=373956 RepID=A0AAN8XPY3_HALRR